MKYVKTETKYLQIYATIILHWVTIFTIPDDKKRYRVKKVKSKKNHSNMINNQTNNNICDKSLDVENMSGIPNSFIVSFNSNK